MKKILVINPNTSKTMTEDINKTALLFANKNFLIDTVRAEKGPTSIDNFYEEAMSTVEVIKKIKMGSSKGYDGFLIACGFDPGIYGARNITDKPVIGIGEASFFVASMLGYKFSIIDSPNSAWAVNEDNVNRIGLEKRLASIRTIEFGEVQCCENKRLTIEKILTEAKLAITQDHAEVIVLGCAGMTGMDLELENELNIPVVDPIKAGISILQTLISMNERTSQVSIFKKNVNKK